MGKKYGGPRLASRVGNGTVTKAEKRKRNETGVGAGRTEEGGLKTGVGNKWDAIFFCFVLFYKAVPISFIRFSRRGTWRKKNIFHSDMWEENILVDISMGSGTVVPEHRCT